MAKPTGRSPRATRIDWVAARNWYMEDARRSYADVAKQFGVAKRSVEFQAKQATDADGNPTTWAILRRDVGDQALEQHEEKLAAEQSKRNDQHTYMYRRMQELTLKKIDSMYHGKPVMLKDSSPLLGPDGKPVMLFPDGVEL